MNPAAHPTVHAQSVLGICGSLRSGSYSLLAMQRVQASAQRSGLYTDNINVDDLRLPLCRRRTDGQGVGTAKSCCGISGIAFGDA